MNWLRTIASARWFPYVLIGAVSTVLTVFGWGFIKGYNKAENEYLIKMNRAMQAQYERLELEWKTRITLALREAERSNNVRRRMSEIRIPINCVIPDHCVRAFNDAVLAAGTHTAGIEGAP